MVTDELHGADAGGFAVRRLPSAATATAAVRDPEVAVAYVDHGSAATVYLARAPRRGGGRSPRRNRRRSHLSPFRQPRHPAGRAAGSYEIRDHPRALGRGNPFLVKPDSVPRPRR